MHIMCESKTISGTAIDQHTAFGCGVANCGNLGLCGIGGIGAVESDSLARC